MGSSRYATALEQLKDMFVLVNSMFYGNTLETIEIIIEPANRCERVRYIPDDQVIKLSSRNVLYGNRDEALKEILWGAALLYANQLGIKVSSNRGIYLNKSFKNILESHGASCYRHKKYGFRPSDLDNDAIRLLESCSWFLSEPICLPDDSISFSSVLVKRPTSTRKYICPSCGNSFRATKNINVICADCGERFIKSDAAPHNSDEIDFKDYYEMIFGEVFTNV